MRHESLKKVEVTMTFEEFFPGFALQEKPSVEMTETGVRLTGRAFGNHIAPDEWFPAKVLAAMCGYTESHVRQHCEKRPASYKEKRKHRSEYGKGNTIHYMYR